MSRSEELSIEWNLIKLGGPTYGIVTKTVHKTVPGSCGDPGSGDLGDLFDMKLNLAVCHNCLKLKIKV